MNIKLNRMERMKMNEILSHVVCIVSIMIGFVTMSYQIRVRKEQKKIHRKTK